MQIGGHVTGSNFRDVIDGHVTGSNFRDVTDGRARGDRGGGREGRTPPFAIETYGKFGKVALKHLKILQTMALEEGVRCEAGITPWFARSFVDGATQAIGVALQRSIVRDQLRRAHVRRSQGDACCDEGCSSSGSDSDGGQGSSVRASSQSSEGAAA